MIELNKRMVNLTSHMVSIVKDNGSVVQFPPSGTVARVFTDYVIKGSINGISLVETVTGGVFDLPPPRRNTTYIVSRLVLEACPERWDLVVPHDLVRNYNGSVLGARCFARK